MPKRAKSDNGETSTVETTKSALGTEKDVSNEVPPKHSELQCERSTTRPVETSSAEPAKEIGGQKGPEPTRFGDWEKNGRCTDF